jgi:hypothetical protein
MSARTVVVGNSFLVMMCGCHAENASYSSMVAAVNKQRSSTNKSPLGVSTDGAPATKSANITVWLPQAGC